MIRWGIGVRGGGPKAGLGESAHSPAHTVNGGSAVGVVGGWLGGGGGGRWVGRRRTRAWGTVAALAKRVLKLCVGRLDGSSSSGRTWLESVGAGRGLGTGRLLAIGSRGVVTQRCSFQIRTCPSSCQHPVRGRAGTENVGPQHGCRVSSALPAVTELRDACSAPVGRRPGAGGPRCSAASWWRTSPARNSPSSRLGALDERNVPPGCPARLTVFVERVMRVRFSRSCGDVGSILPRETSATCSLPFTSPAPAADARPTVSGGEKASCRGGWVQPGRYRWRGRVGGRARGRVHGYRSWSGCQRVGW